MITNKTIITKELSRDMAKIIEKNNMRFAKITKYICLSAAIMSFFLAGNIIYLGAVSTNTLTFLGYIVIGIVGIFAFYPGPTLIISNKLYKQAMQTGNEIKYSFDEEGISMKSNLGKSKAKWSGSNFSWCETKNYAYLQIAKGQFCSIDKNGFTNGSYEDLQKLFEKKLTKMK